MVRPETLADGAQIILDGSFPCLGGRDDRQGSIDQGYTTGMTPEAYDGALVRGAAVDSVGLARRQGRPKPRAAAIVGQAG